MVSKFPIQKIFPNTNLERVWFRLEQANRPSRQPVLSWPMGAQPIGCIGKPVWPVPKPAMIVGQQLAQGDWRAGSQTGQAGSVEASGQQACQREGSWLGRPEKRPGRFSRGCAASTPLLIPRLPCNVPNIFSWPYFYQKHCLKVIPCFPVILIVDRFASKLLQLH